MVDREGNITALFYFRDQPLTSDADTQEIVLEVCKDEGLQQVIWISRPLSAAELPSRYEVIYQEGVRRYGHPRDGTRPQTVLWPAGRTLLAIRKAAAGQQRLIMIASGEQYERCSNGHEAATGHRAAVHIYELLDGPEGPQK
jgi:hypothetical protein